MCLRTSGRCPAPRPRKSNGKVRHHHRLTGEIAAGSLFANAEWALSATVTRKERDTLPDRLAPNVRGA